MRPLPDIISISSDEEDPWDNHSGLEDGVEALNFDNLAGPHHGAGSHYDICLAEIVKVFPDISHDHARSLYDKEAGTYGTHLDNVALQLIDKILDTGNYPKEKERLRELKRKRESNVHSDEEEAARWKGQPQRQEQERIGYSKIAKAALSEAFPMIPSRYIHDTFNQHQHYYGAFFAIDKVERSYGSSNPPPYARLKSKRVNTSSTSVELMSKWRPEGNGREELKQEIDAAKQRERKEDGKRQVETDAAMAKEAIDKDCRARGDVMECACCFDEATSQEITYCNGDIPHFFCYDCARSNANNDIGNSRYDLFCMDGSGCKATFSRAQRTKFLDVKTIEKLERLQQQAEIRQAELENLDACPFCEFAAICPPVEVDKELRCRNPECEEISCRLCKLKSHIPMSCEEFKKENGVSQRRAIEEARTAALLRTCSNCKVPIVKEDGCNKVVCTICRNTICDYCGKDITAQGYSHFDTEGTGIPGGKRGEGKCQLYDKSGSRKDDQIEQAGKEAMERVRRENPEISEEDLKIKFAKEVEKSTNRGTGVPVRLGNGAVFNLDRQAVQQGLFAVGGAADLPQQHLAQAEQLRADQLRAMQRIQTRIHEQQGEMNRQIRDNHIQARQAADQARRRKARNDAIQQYLADRQRLRNDAGAQHHPVPARVENQVPYVPDFLHRMPDMVDQYGMGRPNGEPIAPYRGRFDGFFDGPFIGAGPQVGGPLADPPGAPLAGAGPYLGDAFNLANLAPDAAAGGARAHGGLGPAGHHVWQHDPMPQFNPWADLPGAGAGAFPIPGLAPFNHETFVNGLNAGRRGGNL